MSGATHSERAGVRRRFKPYPAYKDSGVEWLGEIPAHWEVSPVFTLAQERDVRNIGGGETNVLSLSYGRIVRRDISDNFGLMPESFDTYQIVDPGNIVLRLTDLQNDKRSLRVGLVGERGIITSAYVALGVRPQLLPAYAASLLHAYDVTKVFYSFGGGVRQTMKFEDLKWMALLVPPEPEQRAIAAFLDRETARIDALVAKKERLIELLREKRTALITRAVTKNLDPNVPMKDSGVEWLDQYPVHWTGLPLKRWVATKITDGPHETPELLMEGVDFISAEAVQDGRIDFDKRRGFISPDLHAYYCRKCRPMRDDILICKSGATTGKLARVDLDMEFSVWSPLALVRSNRSLVLPGFLELALGSEYVQKQIKRTWSAGTQPNISMGDLEQLFVVAPPIEEQAKILAYMEPEREGFELLSARIRDAIDHLKELRTALISAAVTGKIKVNDE